MNDIGFTILTWFLGLLSTVITSFLLPMLFKYFSAKANNEKLAYIINELGETIAESVEYTNQTFVNQLKLDGKFDIENQKKALNMSVQYTLDTLTNKTKKIISKEGIDLNSLIEKKVEAYINKNK